MTKRAGKKKKQAHVSVVPVDTTAETMGDGATVPGPVSQSGSPPALPDQPNDEAPQQSQEDSTRLSVFWPELDPEAMEQAAARGQGDAVKRVADFRLELMAVNNGYPIPAELRARMVYEATKAMLNTKLDFRARAWAMKLLHGMDQSNRSPAAGLPDQVQANQTVNVQVNVDKPESGPSVTKQEIVAELLSMPAVVHAIDRYEFKDDGVDYAQ